MSVMQPPDRGRPGRMRAGRPRSQEIWSKRRAGIEPGADDLLAGGEPHPVMCGDIAERLVEPLYPVRYADQIGMQADRHDPAGLGALGVERVELAFDRRGELFDRAV